MTALSSAEVAELHAIAARDRRLDKIDRTLLAEVARTGHVGSAESLAKRCNRKSPGDVAKRIEKMRGLGYLPAAA